MSMMVLLVYSNIASEKKKRETVFCVFPDICVFILYAYCSFVNALTVAIGWLVLDVVPTISMVLSTFFFF